jgi:hypothetical protein
MKNEKTKVEQVAGLLFMSRDAGHLAHLKTPSYSKHMALNSFYDELIELADEFIEVSQGAFGILDITIYDNKANIEKPAEMLEYHLKQLKSAAKDCEIGALKNIMDEIEGLYLRTIYKVRYLS